VAGNLPVNPTPFKLGVLQDTTVDFKGDLKKLYGQYQLPVATARGKIDCTIKTKLAVFDPDLLNQVFWAQTATPGYSVIVDGEAIKVNVNVMTINNAPVVEDWGVIDAVTGEDFINVPNVAAINAAGQYAVVNLTTGTYAFGTADVGNTRAVKISYTYAVNTGVTIALANQLMGYAPELKMLLYIKFRNKYLSIELNDVTLGNISIPTKLEDFWIMDLDGAANADASNNLGKMMMDTF
jgi:hypothetical protein